MSVRISEDAGRNLQATVSGDFDFETSRTLLLGLRKRWQSGMSGVDVTLRDVTRATSCSIGTLMLISEFAGRNFRIHLEHCQSDVSGLFSSGLLDRFFPPEVLAGCRGCLDRPQPACLDSAH
ncbi:MAG TPA: hypothetical protein VFY24_09990 [Azospira sp.]|nr:hypothetical protein [Azospira sp.]